MTEPAATAKPRAIIICHGGGLCKSAVSISSTAEKQYGRDLQLFDTLDWLSRHGVKVLIPEPVMLATAKTTTSGNKLHRSVFDKSKLLEQHSILLQAICERLYDTFRSGSYSGASHPMAQHDAADADISIAATPQLTHANWALLSAEWQESCRHATQTVNTWNSVIHNAELASIENLGRTRVDPRDNTHKNVVRGFRTTITDSDINLHSQPACAELALHCIEEYPDVPVFIFGGSKDFMDHVRDINRTGGTNIGLLNMAGYVEAFRQSHLDTKTGMPLPPHESLNEQIRNADPFIAPDSIVIDEAWPNGGHHPFQTVMEAVKRDLKHDLKKEKPHAALISAEEVKPAEPLDPSVVDTQPDRGNRRSRLMQGWNRKPAGGTSP